MRSELSLKSGFFNLNSLLILIHKDAERKIVVGDQRHYKTMHHYN